MVPLAARTATLMVLLPTLRFIELEALPLVTEVPFTVTLAAVSVRVGVTVVVVVA